MTALSDGEFAQLRTLLASSAGLVFDQSRREALGFCIAERLRATGSADVPAYLLLLDQPTERQQLLDEVTIQETHFFRNPPQVRALREHVLPELVKAAAGTRRLRVWSAGCSTGEEVYTIAILLRESGLFDGWDRRVYGSDLSKRCVATARRGIYGSASFRAMAADTKRKYFTERPDGAHISEPIRAMCQFGQMNLLDGDKARLMGRADAIFCRNVLIYFDAHARKRVIDIFHDRLFPGGVLLLGHAESLLNVSTAFELLHLKEDLVYKKPSTDSRDPDYV